MWAIERVIFTFNPRDAKSPESCLESQWPIIVSGGRPCIRYVKRSLASSSLALHTVRNTSVPLGSDSQLLNPEIFDFSANCSATKTRKHSYSGAMSKKRRRDPSSVDTQLVEIYEDLANESEEIRLKAAHSLLCKVSGETLPSKEKLTEILGRLVRGLCSGRKAARLGFSIAFTEFLIQVVSRDGQNVSEALDFSEVFHVVEQQTDIGSNVSGQVACCPPTAGRQDSTNMSYRKKEITS